MRHLLARRRSFPVPAFTVSTGPSRVPIGEGGGRPYEDPRRTEPARGRNGEDRDRVGRGTRRTGEARGRVRRAPRRLRPVRVSTRPARRPAERRTSRAQSVRVSVRRVTRRFRRGTRRTEEHSCPTRRLRVRTEEGRRRSRRDWGRTEDGRGPTEEVRGRNEERRDPDHEGTIPIQVSKIAALRVLFVPRKPVVFRQIRALPRSHSAAASTAGAGEGARSTLAIRSSCSKKRTSDAAEMRAVLAAGVTLATLMVWDAVVPLA